MDLEHWEARSDLCVGDEPNQSQKGQRFELCLILFT